MDYYWAYVSTLVRLNVRVRPPSNALNQYCTNRKLCLMRDRRQKSRKNPLMHAIQSSSDARVSMKSTPMNDSIRGSTVKCISAMRAWIHTSSSIEIENVATRSCHKWAVCLFIYENSYVIYLSGLKEKWIAFFVDVRVGLLHTTEYESLSGQQKI